jgi:hypothetical protein
MIVQKYFWTPARILSSGPNLKFLKHFSDITGRVVRAAIARGARGKDDGKR